MNKQTLAREILKLQEAYTFRSDDVGWFAAKAKQLAQLVLEEEDLTAEGIGKIINYAKQEQKEKDAEIILGYAKKNWRLSNYIFAELLAKAISDQQGQ